jgi:hypothetical protein
MPTGTSARRPVRSRSTGKKNKIAWIHDVPKSIDHHSDRRTWVLDKLDEVIARGRDRDYERFIAEQGETHR